MNLSTSTTGQSYPTEYTVRGVVCRRVTSPDAHLIEWRGYKETPSGSVRVELSFDRSEESSKPWSLIVRSGSAFEVADGSTPEDCEAALRIWLLRSRFDLRAIYEFMGAE